MLRYNSLKNNETNDRPRTAPGNVDVNQTPIEIQITSGMCCDSNLEPSHQKKPGFWKSIFSERKEKKKIYKMKNKNSSFKDRSEGQVSCQKCSASAEIQKSANCPTKCNLPVNQGVGCHLYFCIDRKRKKNPVKNKKAINIENEEIHTNFKQNCLSYKMCDNLTCKEEGKVTIFCDEPSAETKQTTDYNQIRSNLRNNETNTETKPTTDYNQIRSNLLIKQTSLLKNKSRTDSVNFDVVKPIYPRSSKTIYQAQTADVNIFRDYEFKKGNKDESPKLERHNLDRESITKGFAFETAKPIIKQAPKEEGYSIDKVKKNRRGGSSDVKAENSILKRNAEFWPTNNTENVVMAVNIRDTVEVAQEKGFEQKGNIYFEANSEASDPVRYSNFDFSRNERRRRSTMIAKNSLISMRKERRQSQVENHVYLILDKLNDIENKINDLEIISKAQDNNITMGISCNAKESRVDIQFDKSSKKLENKEHDSHTLVKVSSSNAKENKTIKIQSQNESIYIRTPADVNIVKSRPIEVSKSRSKQLIFENTQMDAHTIGSNSRTIKCDNPRIVISQCSKKPSHCANPGCFNKWRRISQELKVSQQDIKNTKTFCKCEGERVQNRP